MTLRPSEPTIRKDERYENPQWIVEIDGNPIRYFPTEAEAEAFVDGFNYIWQRD